jgi:hypothetical protein
MERRGPPLYLDILSSAVVPLPRADFLDMLRLVRLFDRISRLPAYRALVAPLVPEVARFDPGHDAVMMCYDFHLSDEGPKLIEVNTNAGGSLPAYLSSQGSGQFNIAQLSFRQKRRLLSQFSIDYGKFMDGGARRPGCIAIVDERPEEQFLYREMLLFAELFTDWGAVAEVVDPSELVAGTDGVLLHGQPVDLVYNRHCDFYLEDAEMAGLRAAYLAGKVCLTPNPFIYALLADKRRLTLWSGAGFAEQLSLSIRDAELLRKTIPHSRMLAAFDPSDAWAKRRKSVFKPVTRFGSRGVLLGAKISRKRFDQLDPDETLVQELVPPSKTEVPEAGPMKADFRVYAYCNRVLGVTARLYRGQVTNLRTVGGGFARVEIV